MMNDARPYLRSGTQGARLINLSYTMVNNAKWKKKTELANEHLTLDSWIKCMK